MTSALARWNNGQATTLARRRLMLGAVTCKQAFIKVVAKMAK